MAVAAHDGVLILIVVRGGCRPDPGQPLGSAGGSGPGRRPRQQSVPLKDGHKTCGARAVTGTP
jgi:hypothetical protein